MKHTKLLLETAIMAGGLALVLSTLSGTTRDLGVIISVISLLFFLASGLLDDTDTDTDGDR